MSKRCRHCGVKHVYTAEKCAGCGAMFNDAHIYKARKTIIILSVVIVLAAVAGIFSYDYYTGPRFAASKVMSAFKDKDAEAVLSYIPDFLKESEKIDGDEFVRKVSLNVSVMSRFLYTYNTEKPQTPSEQYRSSTFEAIAEYAGEDFDLGRIEDIKSVWVNYTGNIRGYWPKHALRLILIKYDGRWVWWPDVVGR